DDCLVKLWDVATGKEKKSWQAHELGVYCMAFSPDGKTLATCCGDWKKGVPGEVKLWDANTGNVLRTLTGYGRGVWTLAFWPDGKSLAPGAGSTPNGSAPMLKVWETATGKEVARFSVPPYVRCVAFSRDGKILAAGLGDGNVRLWDVNGWKDKQTVRTNNDLVFSVDFSLDGRTLITASKDGTAKYWELTAPPKMVAAAKQE